MKDMITTIASIMLLMIFVLQFVTNQITYTGLTGSREVLLSNLSVLAAETGEVSGRKHPKLKKKCRTGA